MALYPSLLLYKGGMAMRPPVTLFPDPDPIWMPLGGLLTPQGFHDSAREMTVFLVRRQRSDDGWGPLSDLSDLHPELGWLQTAAAAEILNAPPEFDIMPPIFTGVPADVVLEATSPGGAVVTYTAPSATDLVSGTVDVNCVPASGATVALGTTTAACSAQDGAGNGATATFTVTVRDTPPPHTQITSAVDGNGEPLVGGDATVSTAITITFVGSDVLAVTGFECSLDSEP